MFFYCTHTHGYTHTYIHSHTFTKCARGAQHNKRPPKQFCLSCPWHRFAEQLVAWADCSLSKQAPGRTWQPRFIHWLTGSPSENKKHKKETKVFYRMFGITAGAASLDSVCGPTNLSCAWLMVPTWQYTRSLGRSRHWCGADWNCDCCGCHVCWALCGVSGHWSRLQLF